MISKTEDITAAFNASNSVTIDVGGFDFVIVQFVSLTDAVNFYAAISDASGGTLFGNGSAATAEDFYPVYGIDVSNGDLVNSANASATSTTVKFNMVGKFLNFSKTSVTAANVYIQYIKAA